MNEILSLRREFKIDDYIEKVKPVVDAVRREGDKAVIKFTKEFDGVELREIKVGEDEIDAAYDEVSDDLQRRILRDFIT